MAKYDEIMSRIWHHYNETLGYFPDNHIVGVWLQGSQNYGLDLPTSDVDTKCILTPTLKDICKNAVPVSTTHIRANEEHTDWKDVRLYCETFRKQNLNFLEILFTPYFVINPLYAEQWNRLVAAREGIARMNPWRAVKSMKGIALEKYHAMEHPYPSKLDILAKYYYDPKQTHHLARVDNYLTRYIKGESYEDCLTPDPAMKDFLMDIKVGNWPLDKARELAKMTVEHVEKIADEFCNTHSDEENVEMRELLDDVCYNIIKISIQEEMNND